MNKKKFLIFLLAALIIPATALATVANIQDLVKAIVGDVLWVIFGGIVVICFIYSGILFLSAGGDAEKLRKARSSLMWGIIGVIVGILAWSAITFIGNTLDL